MVDSKNKISSPSPRKDKETLNRKSLHSVNEDETEQTEQELMEEARKAFVRGQIARQLFQEKDSLTGKSFRDVSRLK